MPFPCFFLLSRAWNITSLGWLLDCVPSWLCAHKFHGNHTQGTHSFHLASAHLLSSCWYGWLLSSLRTSPYIFTSSTSLSFSCSLKSFIAFAYHLFRLFCCFFFFVTRKTINELQTVIWNSACNKLMHSFECIKQARSSLSVSFYCALECQPAHSPPELLACVLGHPLTLIHGEAPCLWHSACIRGCTWLLIGPDAHI